MKATLTTIAISATALSPVVLSHPLGDDSTNHTSLYPRQMITSMNQGQPASIPIHITTYSQRDCKGTQVRMTKDAVLGYNYDAPNTWSLSIDRDLMNDEQIDVSFQPGKKRGLQFVGDLEDRADDDDDDDDDSGSLDDLVPTATEIPGVTKRAENKHCSKYITSAPTAPAAMTKGCWNVPGTQHADCVRLWMYPNFAPPKN